MKKLVSAGEIVVEIMADRLDQSLTQPGLLHGPFPSGAPAIFIAQAARLGQPAGLISAVGEDDFGRMNIDRLRDWGADVSAITVHQGQATGTAFVSYRADGSRHFVFNIKNSAAGLIETGDGATALLAGADHFHVMGSSLFSKRAISVVLAGIETIKRNGGTVSFDPNIRREMIELPGMREALNQVLALTDIFLPSGEELFIFTKATDEAEAAAEMLERGISAVIVKKGAEGAVYYDRHRKIAASGFVVDEVDPTGAGDCFGAGFVSLWLRGAAPEEALRLACACGALAVTRKGPMEGIATFAEVQSFLSGATARTVS
ncbi:sugar kinase [Rhizobium rhizogenes]|uniref:sugar kinase n=1 Tax=Rhizobium rhizogenes TaxID=359 RepID=UPI00056AF4BC|nr:sugar kinase [Rhizobium rhizogenes]NTG90270.1 sugar kinase [Rhizobium rhizogenes]NTH22555.1 sugar kinase [Rhizobium rhizogenes]NTH35585.1 sugar kinase [Rhizobium rhizogenes]NTH81138.1 sugar kinase [Rhizobium rhizogenes]NTH87115.1 sugar kinase [Rhizobium rhizogenes]